jgi:glycosyltransferase involved in cell wall biosynthesis
VRYRFADDFGRDLPRLSLIVISKNEEASIGRCLRSAAFADEMVVVDNGSTDKTVEIARTLGARVIETADWPGFGPQKNRALDAAAGDWVLSLDADEWIEPALANEIRATIARGDAAEGYEISRRSRFCGKVVRHCGWSPDYVLRLFRRGRGRFSDDKVHEHVDVQGRVEKLKNPIEHDSITDLADAENKIERYAAAAAAALRARGKNSSPLKAHLRGLGAFLRTYILRLGFLDGKTGWLVADYNRRYTFEKWKRAVK